MMIAAEPKATGLNGPYLIDTCHHGGLALGESKDRPGRPVVRGVFGKVGVETNNGRIYEEKIIRREIDRMQEDLKNRRVYGELDHPADGRTRLGRVSHVITSLSIEGDEIVGEAEILDTDAGRTLKAIAEAAPPGTSSRGIGTTRPGPNGAKIVQPDFRLLTFDFVAEPATPGAFPKFYMEGKEVDVKDMDAQKVREAFPDIVREIELESENRGRSSANLTIAELKEKSRAELREEFSARLATALSDLQTKLLAKQPETKPEAKQTESEARTVSSPTPASTDPATLAKIEEVTRRAKQAEEQLSAVVAEKQALEKRAEEIGEMAKTLGYRFRVMEKLQGHPASEQVISRLGDPAKCESLDELDEKIDQITHEIEQEAQQEAERLGVEKRRLEKTLDRERAQLQREAQERVEVIQTTAKRAVGELRAEAQELESEKAEVEQLKGLLAEEARERRIQNKKLKRLMMGKLSEAQHEVERLQTERDDLESKFKSVVKLAEELGTVAYAERRIARRSDAPRVRKLLGASRPRDRAHVDELLESIQAPRDSDSEFERIRRHVSRSKATLTEVAEERGVTDDRKVMGVSMAEMQFLAGVPGTKSKQD